MRSAVPSAGTSLGPDSRPPKTHPPQDDTATGKEEDEERESGEESDTSLGWSTMAPAELTCQGLKGPQAAVSSAPLTYCVPFIKPDETTSLATAPTVSSCRSGLSFSSSSLVQAWDRSSATWGVKVPPCPEGSALEEPPPLRRRIRAGVPECYLSPMHARPEMYVRGRG